MTPQEARAYLASRARPEEGWVRHSRQVARVAVALGRALAAAGRPVDLPALEVQALLHDVGRSLAHSPLHGWAGYVLLRRDGAPQDGRGCLVHWLKGREPAEVAATTSLPRAFLDRVYAALDPREWRLEDSVLSVADSCVRHDQVVGVDERHGDLIRRYGDSVWLRRAWELARAQAADLEAAVGRPLDEVLAPLRAAGHPPPADVEESR